MVVTDAGCGVPDHVVGEIVATGAGWCWILGSAGPFHLSGPMGVRGPRTVRCASDPPGAVGDPVALNVDVERWRAATPGPPALPHARRALARTLARATERDPADLAGLSMSDAIAVHGGRGAGLTPEGDDLLMGLVAGRRAVANPRARDEAALLADWATDAAGEPSRALLCHAARGELVEPAHDALAALLGADAEGLGVATPILLAWGASSGRALLAGLAAGVWGPTP